MATVTICSDFGAQENKFVAVSIVSSSICLEVMGLDTFILKYTLTSINSTTKSFVLHLSHTYWRGQWHPTPVFLPGKSIALTRQTFVGKAKSLLFGLQSMGSLGVGHD